MTTQLETNEYYRVNSYYWQGMVYIVLETKDDKSLCQIKGSKSTPKWIKTNQLSKTLKDFRSEHFQSMPNNN
jgi:hypothetical protein